MKKFKFLIVFIAFLSTGLMYSCEEKRLDGMVDDSIYLTNPGVQRVSLLDREKDFAKLTVIKSGVGLNYAKLKVTVDANLLEKYKDHLPEEVQLLDAKLYRLVDKTIDFAVKDYEKSFDFEVDVAALKQLTAGGGQYALPCKVTIEGGTAALAKKAVLEEVFLFDIKQPYIYFDVSGVISAPLNVTSAAGDVFWFYAGVHTSYQSAGDISFEVAVDEQFVRDYNTANGTSLAPMPAAAIAFIKDKWNIPAGSNARQLDYQILKSKLVDAGGNPAYGEYWLPLVITKVSKYGINPQKNMQIWRVLYSQ